MALISEETILEVKRALDIGEVIGSYFPLRRAGSNLKALCPFHEEKTPSFNVRPATQTFHCFGCGKKGDLIGFVMEHERVDYPEAIKILADRAGVAIRYKEGGGEEGPGRREIARANEWAAGVFRSLLKTAEEGRIARDFLQRRGVSEETAETWQIGYSMASWDFLLQRGKQGGLDDRLLAAGGLAIPREGRGGYYDRFRNRLMFPIGDLWGKPIAFGARTLGDDQPKFLNSPETKIFSKGRGFYGLHAARETLEETKTIYIVEGYLDVIVPWQAGVKGLVATLGTALTRDHLKILRRYVDKVVLVFDADAAGQKAAERGLDLLLSENVDIFVAELPAGMDPDDVVLQKGPDALRECLEKPREIFDFLMTALTGRHGGETPAAKQRVVEEMTARIGQIPDPVKQELLVQQLSKRFGLDERTLKSKIIKELRPAAPPVRPERPKAETGRDMEMGKELLACLVADPGIVEWAKGELSLEAWPEGLQSLARRVYGTPGLEAAELVRGATDEGTISIVTDVVERAIGKDAAKSRAIPLVRDLKSALNRKETEALRRLNVASEEEEREKARLLAEKFKNRPSDNRRLPGR